MKGIQPEKQWGVVFFFWMEKKPNIFGGQKVKTQNHKNIFDAVRSSKKSSLSLTLDIL